MEAAEQSSISTFALIVDKLRNKNEEELKLLYTKFFSKELIDEWKDITEDAVFKNANEEEIINAIKKNL